MPFDIKLHYLRMPKHSPFVGQQAGDDHRGIDGRFAKLAKYGLLDSEQFLRADALAIQFFPNFNDQIGLISRVEHTRKF